MTFVDFLTASLALAAAPLELLLASAGVGSHPASHCDPTDPHAVHACIPEEMRRHDSPTGPKHEVHGQLRTAHHFEGQPDPYQPSVRGVGLQEWPHRHLTSDPEHPKFAVDDLVELYWEGSFFAIPCLVYEGTAFDGHINKYNLWNSIMDVHHEGVPEVLIHPYTKYTPGTEAHCNVGAPPTVRMVPCEVVSSEVKKSGIRSTAYEVAYPGYTNGEDAALPSFLPFDRVQRLRREDDTADEEPIPFGSIFG